MKRLIIITTIILLVVNGLLGLILTTYHSINFYLNSGVILLTGILLVIISSTHLKDAFKISLYSLFTIVGGIEYILGFFAPEEWNNNWFIILVLAVSAIEIIIILLTNYVINKTNEYESINL